MSMLRPAPNASPQPAFMAVRPVTAAWMAAMFLTSFWLLGCPSSPSLSSRLADGERSADDKARDADRHPAAVVSFLRIEDGMTVMDVLASGGYYTEVLSEAVGPDGEVYAQNVEYALKLRDGEYDKELTARLANGRLPNVTRLDREIDDLGIAPGSIAVAFTALNFHDIYNGRGPEATMGFLRVMHSILAPDGVLGIVDHSGKPGLDNSSLHRIEKSVVIEVVESADFVLDASSDVLRNPKDDQTQNVFVEGMRGKTDRFVLRFRKAPAS